MKKKKNNQLLILIGLITLCNSHMKRVKELEEEICKVGGVPPDKNSGNYWLEEIWGDEQEPESYAKSIIKYKRG